MALASFASRIAPAALLALLGGAILGCAARRSPGSASAPDGSGGSAFRAAVRVVEGEKLRRVRMRVYAAPPDSFRVEGSGPVGGIAVIATGRNGRMRIVVPSRRIYSEGALSDDLGTALLGLRLDGCEILRAVFLAGGLKPGPRGGRERAAPCGAGANDPETVDGSAPPHVTIEGGRLLCTYRSPAGRIEIISSRTAEEVGCFLPGPIPAEVRVFARGDAAPRMVLSDLRPLPWPDTIPDGFFWEPLPAGSRHVTVEEAELEHEP